MGILVFKILKQLTLFLAEHRFSRPKSG